MEHFRVVRIGWAIFNDVSRKMENMVHTGCSYLVQMAMEVWDVGVSYLIIVPMH